MSRSHRSPVLPAGYPDGNVCVPWVSHTAHKRLTPGPPVGRPPPPPGQSPEKIVYVYVPFPFLLSLEHGVPAKMPFSLSFSKANNRKSVGHRPVDPILSRRVFSGHPGWSPRDFLKFMCPLLSLRQRPSKMVRHHSLRPQSHFLGFSRSVGVDPVLSIDISPRVHTSTQLLRVNLPLREAQGC